MRSTGETRLDSLLREIEDILVETIPRSIERLEVKEKVYCLFIRYYDTSVGEDYTPYVSVAPDRLRQSYVTRRGADAKHFIWSPQDLESDKPMPGELCEGHELAKKCNESYRLMCAANRSGLPMVDESELLMPFRGAMHRVAARLNGQDWTGILDTTDDFIVLPTDEIGYWTASDMRASIPAERLEFFRSLGLI